MARLVSPAARSFPEIFSPDSIVTFTYFPSILRAASLRTASLSASVFADGATVVRGNSGPQPASNSEAINGAAISLRILPPFALPHHSHDP